MNSFILYFKKSPAFFIALIVFLMIESFLYLIPDLYYNDGGGAFLTTYKRKIAEDSEKKFDILMYGDSRSLSIIGNPKSDSKKYSLYNFSLPAAGIRYFKYFLMKYQKSHPNPKAIIWAADPEQYALGKNKAFDTDPKLWAKYKHRLLNLFSIFESWEQYEGKELFFIIKEYIPNYLLSIKYRQGIEAFITGFKFKSLTGLFESSKLPIEGVDFRKKEYLISKIPNRVRNKRIKYIIDKQYGQVNLGDYFEVNPLIAEMLQKKQWKSLIEKMQGTKFYLEYLEDFIQYCEKEKIKLIILNLPRAEGYNDTPYFRAVVPSIKKLSEKYPNTIYLEFPEMDYKLKLFGEGIHFTTEGSDRLNKEFSESVYPKIVKFIDRGDYD